MCQGCSPCPGRWCPAALRRRGKIPVGLSQPSSSQTCGFAEEAGPAGIPAPSPAGPKLLTDPPSKPQASAIRARPTGISAFRRFPSSLTNTDSTESQAPGQRAVFTEHVLPIRASWSPSKHPAQPSKAINKVDTRSGVLRTLHAPGPFLSQLQHSSEPREAA